LTLLLGFLIAVVAITGIAIWASCDEPIDRSRNLWDEEDW